MCTHGIGMGHGSSAKLSDNEFVAALWREQKRTWMERKSVSTRRDSSRTTTSTTMPKDARYVDKRPRGAYVTRRSASSVPIRTCTTVNIFSL